MKCIHMLPNYVDKGMTWIQLYYRKPNEIKKVLVQKNASVEVFKKKITEKPRKKKF